MLRLGEDEMSIETYIQMVGEEIIELELNTTQNMIFSVRLDLVFYHPTLLNIKFKFFDI